MSTDNKPKNKERTTNPVLRIRNLSVNSCKDSIIELIEKMNDVETTSKVAKQNATSISDNNGNRIELEREDYIRK